MLFNPDEELKDFPCSFNLTIPKKVSIKKYKHIRCNIERDLEDTNTSEEEKVRLLNLLTLILFNLDEKDEALLKNDQVLEMTKRQNITALGNYIFLLCKKGDRLSARNCFIKEVKPLANVTFDQLNTQALAEQAFTYLKLGGFQNIQLCIKLFKECVEKFPENYSWKYCLGLAYRRLTNGNLHSVHEEIDVNEKTEECARFLFDVAENGDHRLRGLAYAQLVELRQYSDHPDPEVIFKGLDKMQLLEKALENDSKNYAVLTMCGMGIKEDDVDRAIELLRRSADLRDYSMTFHHLGLCLWKKARSSKRYHKDEQRHGSDVKESIPESKICCPSQESGEILDVTDTQARSDNTSKSTITGIVKICSVDSLVEITSIGDGHLDETDPIIRDAIHFLVKSFLVSHETNMAAKSSLGDIYMDLQAFEKALTQYYAIIETPDSDYLLCQITAHEKAGKCLKILKESSKQNDLILFQEKSNEHFKKALSLAADLSSRNTKYKNCETHVWNAFKLLLEDVEQIPTPKERYKEHFELLDLAQNQDIAKMIKEMLEQGLELDDIEMFHTGLKSYLKNRDYEGALAFLNMACTKSALVNDGLWKSSKIATTNASTYIFAAWWRLTNGSPDSRRVFQQMFQMRYGHCSGMASREEEDSEIKRSDVLLVNDFSADLEDGLDATTILARKLTLVLKVIFGLDASYIESKCDFGQPCGESQLEEMKNYSLAVIIIGDNDSNAYDSMLKALHSIKDTRFLVLNYRQDRHSPCILSANEVIDLTQDPWEELTQSLSSDTKTEAKNEDERGASIFRDVFKDNDNDVMRLFCKLVEEDFDQHCKNFKEQSKVMFE